MRLPISPYPHEQMLFYPSLAQMSIYEKSLFLSGKKESPSKPMGSFVLNQEGFEPPTHGLEGRCSIQLSYGLIRAGDGNRTHVSSLEGWCSTIELHPRVGNYEAKLHITQDLKFQFPSTSHP